MAKKIEWYGSIPDEAKSWLTFSDQSDKGYEYNKYFTEITASTDDNGGSINDTIGFNIAKNDTSNSRNATVHFRQKWGKTATCKVTQKAQHKLIPTGNESAVTYDESVSVTPDNHSCKYNETEYQFTASYTATPKIAKQYYWSDSGESSAFYDTENLTDGTPINDTNVSNFEWEKVSGEYDLDSSNGKITFSINNDRNNTRTFIIKGTYKNHIPNSSGNYSDEGSIIQDKNRDVYHYKIDISPSTSYTWNWNEVDERSFTIESYYTLNDETTKHNVDFQVDDDTSNDFDWRKDGNVIYVKPTGNNNDSANQKKTTFNVKNSGDTITISLTQDITKYDYVDLGLPSGTLWATMNVGASKPSDVGLYFQWGDTQGYTKDQVGKVKQFTWADYKLSIDGSSTNFSKYTTTDATLDLEDDAAHTNMGGTWHMPTPAQISELLNNTTNTWTTQDNVNGRLFTSKTDPSKSIFIPAAGYASDGSIHYIETGGYVWSSMLDAKMMSTDTQSTSDVSCGKNLYFDSSNAYLSNLSYRLIGFSVRGVIGSGPLEETINGYPYVDLGLPSGTKWATMNVGASKPSDAGLYFQWGDAQGYTADQVGTGSGQKEFASDYSDYKWGVGPNFTKYNTTGATLELDDDAAHINMGGSWHIPTPEQCQELIDNTTTAWTTSNGVNGIRFTSKKDGSKTIFIPAAGTTFNGSIKFSGSNGTFQTNMISAVGSGGYYALQVSSTGCTLNNYFGSRNDGTSVRGVVG